MLIRLLRVIPTLILCSSLGLVFLTAFAADWQRTVLYGLSVVGFVLTFISPALVCVMLGVMLCLAAILSASALSFWISVVLAAAAIRDGSFKAKFESHTPSTLAFIGVMLMFLAIVAPAITTLHQQFDLVLLLSIYREGGVAEFVYSLGRPEFIRFFECLRIVGGYAIAVLLYMRLCRWEQTHNCLKNVLGGLAIGALFSSIYLVFQYLEFHPVFTVTRSNFWIFTGRYSSSFSDPNAFCLMGCLMLPMLLLLGDKRWRLPKAFIALFFAVCVLWSGSRTIWLFVIWWIALLFTPAFLKHSKALFYGTICSLFLLVLACGAPSVNSFLLEQINIPAVKRLLLTINWQNAASILSSRILFWKLAAYIWSLSPLVGIGLGGFYHSQDSAAQALDIKLGPWRDNANSFYLQLLAEGGVCAIIILLLSFLALTNALKSQTLNSERMKQRKFVATGSLAAMALMFFLGPHMAFDEVRYLLVILLALGVCVERADTPPSSQLNKNYSKFLGAILLLISIMVGALYLTMAPVAATPPRGVYGLEKGDLGPFRWTSKDAYLSVCEDTGDYVGLNIGASRPDLPLKIKIYSFDSGQFAFLREIILEDRSPIEVNLPLVGNVPQRFWLEVEELWQPSAVLGQGDNRRLGVQVFWRSYFCE